jgi:hypothetical protein
VDGRIVLQRHQVHNPGDLLKLIKEGTLEFISRNTNHLPVYYVPYQKRQQQMMV